MNKDQDQVSELHKVAEKGARTEALLSIAKEIERDMKKNLFGEFCEADAGDMATLTLIKIYDNVLHDFMSHVYSRCQNGEAARLQLKKMTEKLRGDLSELH